jgi:hypothetical protein
MSRTRPTELTILLEQDEREIILRYGGGWRSVCEQIEAKRRWRRPLNITAATFDWEQTVGELSYSLNHDKVPRALIEEVDAVAELLEFELRRR